MRTKTSREEVPLEPLAVYDDTGVFEPEPAVAETDARDTLHELVDALRDVLAERSSVRSQTPWLPSTPPVIPRQHARFLATFNRMIPLHPDRLRELPDWCHRSGDEVQVHRRLTLEEPRPCANGTWRVPGRLRSPYSMRSIPVELVLWPHLGTWTRLCLEPQRRVHVGRAYFRKGHRVLDALSARLISEL